MITRIPKKVKQAIIRGKSVAIFCHIYPDGDAIGSLLSLGLGLEKIGKKVYFISQDGLPRNYRTLPAAQRVRRKLGKPVDLAIAVDCGSKELLGDNFESFNKAKKTIEIDHHAFRESYADLSLVDERAASVGELVYVLLRALNVPITKNIAQNLLTSIIVETNSFRLPAVRRESFAICAELLETGIDFSKLSQLVYWSRRKEAIRLLEICISRLKFLKRGKIAWSIIKTVDFAKTGGDDEDLDPFANDMLSIDTVEIVVLFRQKDARRFRVSLRSKGKVNIALLARRFGGGGHFDAAGCFIPNNEKAIKDLLKAAVELLQATEE